MIDYSNIVLDRDRAFDINYLNELLAQAKSVLTEIMRINQDIDDSVSNISEVYNTINYNYIEYGINSYLLNSFNDFGKGIYQNTIDRISKNIEKLVTDIPANDTKLGQDMKDLKDIVISINDRVNELKELLENGDIGLSYNEFKQRLKDLKVGWDEATEDLAELLLEIENEMLGVSVTIAQYSQDPVNLSTGNFVYDHEDLKIGGEIPLSFHRYYNAKARNKGSMGRCFLHNYEMYLEENAEKGKITICMGDGQQKTFQKKEEGTYQSLYSAIEILTKEKDNYILQGLSGERNIFDNSGKLIRQENRQQRGLSFLYDESGRLERAITDHESFLTYSYDEVGQLILVADHTGRTVKLSYEKGKLVTVETPQGSVYGYRYGKNGRIEETINSRGYVAVKNTYDDKRRVTHQEFPDGGHMEFLYDDSKHQTILTERNGSRITYIHDSKHRNTDILYEDGTKEHFEYNGKNQRILYIDRNGNSTRMAYDNRGNLTQVINALGEKVNLTYNVHNQLSVLTINGKEKLRNSYDSKGNRVSSTGADGNGNKMTYDEAGRPVCIEAADKSVTKLIYDTRGNIVKILDQRGVQTGYEYDSLNRVCRTIDGNGNATLFEYDPADRIIKVTNSLGNSRSYSYNQSGRITKVTDYDGYSIQMEYNSTNRPQTLTDKEGNITYFSYDKMWNITKVQQADGGIHSYKYDTNNRLQEEHFPKGGCISYAYDGNGNRISITDAENNQTSFTYDALNRVTDIQEPNGAGYHYEYDSEGNLKCITDALGNCIRYTYDEMGRRISETDALGNKTTFAYSPLGKIEKVVYPNGTTDEYTYHNGLLKNLYRAGGDSLQYRYDGNNNIVSIVNGYGKEIRYTYDALNRVTEQITEEGNRFFEYDNIGNLTRFTDENGNTTDYEYSPNGNLEKVKDALGNETRYFYDCMGHIIKIEQTGEESVTEVSSQVTTYEWNLDGQIAKIIDPAGDVERYAYDKNGKVKEKWDKDGCHTAYEYGCTGELTGIFYGDGRSVLFSYDALHRLEAVKDWNGTTKIITDALGRTLSVTDPDGRTVSYEWGSSGEKKALTYPNGQRAEYSYNNRGLLETLTTANGKVSYEYDETGRLCKKKLPNGVTTSYVYNGMGRFQQIRHEGEGLFEVYSYRYDGAGNKIGAEKNRNGIDTDQGSFDYIYDALNRLVQVTENGKLLREYEYDAFGNRTMKKEYSGNAESIIQYRYNEKNQVIAEIDNGLEKNYFYDRRGNMTGVCIGEKLVKQFTFDAANQMTSSAEIAGNVMKRAEYRYNGLRQRLGQDVWRADTVETDIAQIAASVPVPENPEEKIRYTLDLTRNYHNLLSLEDKNKSQTFYWDENVVIMEAEGAVNYYLQDDLGSPMHLLDEKRQSREVYGYDEFGMTLCKKGLQSENGSSMLQPFGFTGYQMDAAGGLYFAQARRYDASLGRFISEDFIKGFLVAPVTLNHYGYCWNRPLDFVDLDGLWPKWVENTFKVVTVVGAVVAVGAAIFVPGPGWVVAAAALTGGAVNGFANEASGGSYINGFAGGFVSGGIQGMFETPVGMILAGAANGLGSLITDTLDNIDYTNDKYKTIEQVNKDALKNTIFGMVFSIPGAILSDGVNQADLGNNELVPWTPNFGKGLLQFFNIMDNIFLAGFNMMTGEKTEKE